MLDGLIAWRGFLSILTFSRDAQGIRSRLLRIVFAFNVRWMFSKILKRDGRLEMSF